VVIASSDSDFAPLVARLREKGCRVVGIGQEGKTGDETIGVYDDYEVLTHRGAFKAARSSTAQRTPAKKAKKVAAKKEKKAAPLPDKAQAILDALPGLAAGDKIELRVAAERLREAKLLSKSGSSTKVFGQFPDLFELLPDKQPNHVQRRRT
jgi:hypothetical protein